MTVSTRSQGPITPQMREGTSMENVRTRRWIFVALAVTVVASLGLTLLRAQTSDPATVHRDAIVVDGHVHITNRVFWEGIDPWKAQITGLWDFARAKEGGLDV